MKKLILFISLFAIGNAFGQMITINNSTSNTITVEYRKMDSCNNPVVVSVTINPFTTIGPTSIGAGYTHFAGSTSFDVNTGVPQNAYILTGMLPNANFPTCSVTPNASSPCMFSTPCTVSWTDNPIGGGLADVDILFF